MDYLNRIPIVFDDGGFPTANPDGTGFPVGLEPYKRILELAETNDIVIPVAVTAAYLDVNNVAGLGQVHEKAEEIILFLTRNRHRIPVWNHGLTHCYSKHSTEFDVLDNRLSVPRDIQEEHIALSQEILRISDLGEHKVFVPPGHLWEQDVTDLLAARAGYEYMAAGQFIKTPINRWFLQPNKPHLRLWQDSDHLRLLYRHNTGITHLKTRFNAIDRFKTSIFLDPQNPVTKRIVYRSGSGIREPNHFFAHVQNLVHSDSIPFWDFVIRKILATRKVPNERPL